MGLTMETERMTAKQFRSFVKDIKPDRKKPVQRESQLQQACVRWFRLSYPQYAQLLFSVPNGGHRNKITASRMKAEGQVAGVPDLFLAVARKTFPGLFLEMKAGSENKPTDLQWMMITKLRWQGYKVWVCGSLEDFQLRIKQYLS